MKIWLLAIGTLAFAQSGQGQWVDDLYLVLRCGEEPYERVFIDEKNNIHKIIPHISKSKDLPLPNTYFRGSFYSYWHNNALYTFGDNGDEKGEGGTWFTRWSLARWEGDKWHYLGEYKTDNEELLNVIPCDNNRFIVIACHKDLTNDNRLDRTPFARMSISSGKSELRLDFPIDHGQDELRKYMSYSDCFSMACFSEVVITDKYATVLNHRTGLYWIFSLENASLKKAGNLFKRVTPDIIAKRGFKLGFYDAVLCVNPEKSGTVLIAAQDESFFITETGDPYKEYNENIANDMFFMNDEKTLVNRKKELAERNPYVVWYQLYPVNGKVEKLVGPPEGGTHLRDGGKNDIWRPLPDGSVRMGNLELELIEKNKQKSKISNQKDDNAIGNKNEVNQAVVINL